MPQSIVVVNKIKTKKIIVTSEMSFNQFRVPLEKIISFIGDPITIVGSITLAKGIYFQTILGRKFFTEIGGNVDITFISLVTVYLFYNSGLELYKKFLEIIRVDVSNKEPVEPIPPSEVNEKVPNID